MTGRRELWEVARFSGPRRGFQPQCDCCRTGDPPALVEIEYGPFERRIELAEDVDRDATTAVYEAGMLRLEVPLTK